MVDCGHLAKELAGVDLAQQHFASGGLDHDPHRAAHDEEDVAARVLVVDEPLTGRGAPPGALGIQLRDGIRRQ
jgi:hypothetical protein